MCSKTLGLMIQALSESDQDKLSRAPATEVLQLIRWADGFAWDTHFRSMVTATPDRVLQTGIREVFDLPARELEPDIPARPRTVAEMRRAQFARTSVKIRRALGRRDGLACQSCGCEDDLTVDHVHPLSRGGSDDLDNLQLLCKSCNSSKGARTMAEWVGAQS